MDEYQEVLPRPRFKLRPGDIAETLTKIDAVALWVTPTIELDETTDADDNRFLECAEAGQADYLVTGNTRHFPARWKKTRIVNTREFLQHVVPTH
jgi:putative PIN family toxin of toxin-antitoxin system